MNEQCTMSESDEMEEIDGPSCKRWDPVGATNVDDDFSFEFQQNKDMCSKGSHEDLDKLKIMEEEQEILNSSLISLTTHFAQVQFRLKQIVNAPANKKEEMLRDLEEFAFRGIPDIKSSLIYNVVPSTSVNELGSGTKASEEKDSKLDAERKKQMQLIIQLKTQLQDLEKYAYETGLADLPQSIVMERQNVFIDHLKEKLNFNVSNISETSADDLKMQVDHAINQIVNPIKMKEQLIMQLKTQINDLERFTKYLQGEVTTESLACTCACPVHIHNSPGSAHSRGKSSTNVENRADSHIGIVKKIAEILQLYITSQSHCGSANLQRDWKKDAFSWKDLRTRLDIAVEYVIEVLVESEIHKKDHSPDMNYNSDSDTLKPHSNTKVTSAVRKHLVICLRDLMQHGSTADNTSTSLVPFIGCFSSRSSYKLSSVHPWEIILKYYEIKNGQYYLSCPAQKLSQSFNLDFVSRRVASAKQNLLITIGNIIAMHSPYKRGHDSYFKAFVCAALNERMLVTWLKLILRCQYILETHYMPWSYVIKTGFQDAFHTLDKLTKYEFDLPIDSAIQHLQNIKEAF